MLKVLKSRVYNIGEAAMASGLPMSTDSSKLTANTRRLIRLGSAPVGSAHDCAIKGILVTALIRYPLYWGKQFQRYHFADIISSQSTMHRITKMDLDNCFNKYTSKAVIEILKADVATYNYMVEKKIDEVYLDSDEVFRFSKPDGEFEVYDKYKMFMRIISTCPSGLEIDMEITTNYLQLKTIYNQRKNHKLEDWHVFCDWIKSLPLMEDILKEED